MFFPLQIHYKKTIFNSKNCLFQLLYYCYILYKFFAENRLLGKFSHFKIAHFCDFSNFDDKAVSNWNKMFLNQLTLHFFIYGCKKCAISIKPTYYFENENKFSC